MRLWGFNSTLSNVVNTILAKIEGRAFNANVPSNNAAPQNQMQNNINIPQMMVIFIYFSKLCPIPNQKLII